jgi:paraquat-inducible protein B
MSASNENGAKGVEVPSALESHARHHMALIWAIPALAALIGIWLLVVSVLERGPLIDIRFHSAGGLDAGKTRLEYHDVTIGTVEHIRVSDDGAAAIVSVRVDPSNRKYLVKDSRFYVVRPQISLAGVSGLGTLLSGPYIAIDPGHSKISERHFVGLDTPPGVTSDVPGTQFEVTAAEAGSLMIGSPVYFQRSNVGEVVSETVDPHVGSVTYGLFVRAPFDQDVGSATRFWLASGIDMRLDSNGVRVKTESLAAVLEGGVAFKNQAEAGPSVKAGAGQVFPLFADEDSAMRRPDSVVRPYEMYFNESVRGLHVGAEVNFRGIDIGEVTSIGFQYLPHGQGVRIPVSVLIYPERMNERAPKGGPRHVYKTWEEEKALVDALVAHGLRAQLRSGSLLTGQLYIAMDFFPDAAPATVDWAASTPVIPTEEGSLEEIQTSLASVAKKLDKMPIDELSNELLRTVKTLDGTLAQTHRVMDKLSSDVEPAATGALTQAQQTLASARTTLNADAPTQVALRNSLRQLDRTTRSLEALTDYLEQHPEALIKGQKVQP